MIYLIAFVMVVVLLVAVWRIIGPDQRPGRREAGRGGARPAPRRPMQLPPDDNPDFLRDLDRRARPEE